MDYSKIALAALNALVHVLTALPHIEDHVRAALKANWGADHVQDALRGVDLLSKIVKDVGGELGEAAPVHVPATVDKVDNGAVL